MGNHLYDALLGPAAGSDAPVLVDVGDGGMRYRDLVAAGGRAANALRAAGVKPGDRVAVQTAKSPAALALYLGAIRAGAVFLPLNPTYTPAEVEYFLDDARPQLLVCDPAAADALGPAAAASGAQLLTLAGDGKGSWRDLAERAGEGFDTAARGTDDLAAILYTSGTTGRSKGAMLSHGNLVSNARALRDCWRFSERDVLLHALPIFHTHGLFVAVHVVLMAGAAMMFLPRFDAGRIIELLPRATVMMGVPTFYTRLLERPDFGTAVTANVRVFISGSAPLLADTHREFAERTGHAILERYGMTETGMNTSNPYDGERRAGTVGFPLPGVALRITDPERGTPLARGEVGMIEVRGANVFRGYWGMPEKTAAEFRDDGFFITGDLGIVDERGYLSIVGRSKDLIISGGFNVYPKEVEQLIDGLPGVRESAVIGLPHRDFGEGVTAVVVPRPGAAIDELAVHAGLAGRLARYKQPKRVLIVDELPRNSMGKVQKNLLRDRYRDLYLG